MAFQPESPTYDAGVAQLETTTPVQGGVGGASNAPLLSLANRTAYLKQHVDTLEANQSSLAPLNSPAFTGSPTAPDVAAGDSSGKIANTKFVQNAVGGILTKSVAGNANVTLTAQECGFAIIVLTGALTGNINVIVPSGAGASDEWIFFNNTTGNFTVTVKTAAGAGVMVNQTQSYVLYCDGTDVRAAGAANQSSFTVLKQVATAGQTTFSVQYTPGNLLVFKNGTLLNLTEDYIASSGVDIGLNVACVAGDEVVTVAMSSFTVPNAITPAGATMLGPLLLAGGDTAATPPQFDNDTSIATTAFVQRAQGNMSGQATYSASATLALADLGKFIIIGNGVTLTLPDADVVPPGTTIAFRTGTSVSIAVQVGDVLSVGGTAVGSPALVPSTTGFLIARAGIWEIVGPAALGKDGQFGASIGDPGWQKLPSGLIVQWGTLSVTGAGWNGPNAASGTSVQQWSCPATWTFPIAFPSQCLNVQATPANNSGGTFGAASFYASTLLTTSAQGPVIVHNNPNGSLTFRMFAVGT